MASSIKSRVSTLTVGVLGPIGSGGTFISSGSTYMHVFTSNGTFVANRSGYIYLLLVGGGGGGGADTGGGGGAGGVYYIFNYFINKGSYSITIGQGGTGAAQSTVNNGGNGGNTTFGTFTAIGGGGGGGARNSTALSQGGSGGGGSAVSTYPSNTGGLGTRNQGNSGGQGVNGGSYGSGGGGASAVGGTYTAAAGYTSANGGSGITVSNLSINYYYLPGFNTAGTNGIVSFGGGGGGGSWNNNSQALGGLGGGGAGVGSTTITISPIGIANTGGGGGGGGNGGAYAGAGGSGIVIVAYSTSAVVFPLTPDIIWYKFNSSTSIIGSTVVNSATSGSSYNGTYSTGTISNTTFQGRNCISFTSGAGGDNRAITSPAITLPSSSTIGNGITICFWIYLTSRGSNGGTFFLLDSTTSPGFYTGINTFFENGNIFIMGGYGATSNFRDDGSTPTNFLNTWNHFAITISTTRVSSGGTAGDGIAKYYINGVENTAFNSSTMLNGYFKTEKQYSIQLFASNSSGYMTDFRFYGKPLSSSSINTIYNLNISPLSITGISLWFDAYDPKGDGSTLANGSIISTWADKSGLSNNATSGGATITYDSNGLAANKPALFFNGTSGSDIKYLTGSVNIVQSTATVFVVCKMNSGSANFARVIGFSKNSSTNDYNSNSYFVLERVLYSYEGNKPYQIVPVRNNYYSYYNNPPTDYNAYLVECWFDGTTLYSTTHVGSTTSITTIGFTGDFGISFFTIGGLLTSPSNTYFNGFISEILVYNTCLNNYELQKIEGYLSWKWGLQGNLSPVHPYYSVPP